MIPPDNRGFVARGLEENAIFQRSPFIQGLVSGTKGALLAGPLAAAVQAVRGKDPILGGIAAALVAGLAVGGAKALTQDIQNKEQEAELRYYTQRMKEREPLVFLPPPADFIRLFSKLHGQEHIRMIRGVTPQR
jgi:hypothetical protein